MKMTLLSVATGKEIPEKINENLIKTDQVRGEMYSSFLSESLLKRKTEFLSQLKRLILVQDQIEKEIQKVVSGIKEARQGVMLGEEMNLEETL